VVRLPLTVRVTHSIHCWWLFWCRWIYIFEVFFMISMIYSNQSFSVSPNLFFFLFLSPLSSQITMRRGYREKKNKKKDYRDTSKLQWKHHWYHRKELNEMNSMITRRSPILLPLITFRRQIWHTRVVINDLIWYCWIRLVKIFSMVSIM